MSFTSLKTLEKCHKILKYYGDIEPREVTRQPVQKPKSKPKYLMSTSFMSNKSSVKQNPYMYRSNKKRQNNESMAKSSCKSNSKSNISYKSPYQQESRFEKIMKLKVNPKFQDKNLKAKVKKSIIDTSLSSLNSSRNSTKQNINNNRNKFSRYDKIMNIKVAKPKVNSTLINYQPRMSGKKVVEERESSVKELRYCKQKIRKVKDQEEKQDKLWKVFERERELRQKLRKQTEQREFKERRRKEKRFDSLVSKELKKITKEREVSKRKTSGISYVPFC